MKRFFVGLCVLMILVLAGCSQTVAPLPPVETAKIGTMIGTLSESLAPEKYPEAEISRFNNYVDESAAMMAGKIDYAIMDYATAQNFVKSNEGTMIWSEPLTDEVTAMALKKENTELNQKINGVLNSYLSDGTVDEIKAHWFPEEGGAYEIVDVPKNVSGPVLRVAVTSLTEPRCFVKDGELTGMNVELMSRIAYELGMQVEFQDMDFKAMIDSLQSGTSDVIAAMYNTPERSEKVDFTAGYFPNPQVFVVKEDRIEATEGGQGGQQTISSSSDLNKAGYIIGVPEGTPPEEVAKEFMPNADISYFTQFMDGVAALKSGKVTAVIYDSSGVDRILLSNPDLVKLDEELGNIEIAAVVSLEETKLNDQLNTFIGQFQADGTAAAMYERWINNTGGVMPDIPKPLNPEKKITIITNGLTEPMNYYENGQLTGYDIEFMKRFASYANLDFEIITMDYAAMIPALQSGKGDVIISDFFKTDERGQEVLYSDAYVVLHNSVLVRKSMYSGNIENAEGTAIANQSQTGTGGFFASLQDSFNKTFIVEDRYKLVLEGLWTTIVISMLSLLFGSFLGAVICAMRKSRLKIVSGLAIVYIRLIQGVPIVLTLMILYYILFASVDIHPILIAVVGFSINFAAYSAEIFRTAIDATDKGQLEAAYALGFTRVSSFFKVTLPQALRHILPIFKGEFISMVKMTSVVGYIAIQDLTKMTDIIRSRTFDAFFPLFVTAFIYFVITYLFIIVLGKIEVQVDPKRRKRLVKGVVDPEVSAAEVAE
ncbi:ABC transporter permease subunit [Acetobacterium sp.]|uniref:ABC transporter permease subunit n=1 Tax=Acetobacterium sp. TaxID=1872094 RepID=UPI003593AAB7